MTMPNRVTFVVVVVVVFFFQSSQMVSKSRSALRSPPQTLQRFLLPSPRLPNPNPTLVLAPGISRLPLRLPSSSPESSPLSAASAAALALPLRSDSMASHSRSGVSSIVSSEDTLGERERDEVGVEGMLEKDEALE